MTTPTDPHEEPGMSEHNNTTSIVPAEPGWRILWTDPDTGNLSTDDPVLAWLIVVNPRRGGADEPPAVYADPIGRHGVPEGDQYLSRPDGTVEGPMGERWGSLEAANAPNPCQHRLRWLERAESA